MAVPPTIPRTSALRLICRPDAAAPDGLPVTDPDSRQADTPNASRLRDPSLPKRPDNVLPLRWAPQLAVLAEADCAITHGGSSSVHECVASEVPMAVYSPGVLDQGGIAARVAYHGLGVMGSWNGGRPDSLEADILKLLDDREIRTNLRSMRKVFDRYRDEKVAEAIIERHIAANGDDLSGPS